MTFGNEVLADASYGNSNEDLELVLFSGAVEATRGRLVRLKETAAQVKAAFSDGGWQAFVPAPSEPKEVEFVRRVADGQTHKTMRGQALGSVSSRRETWNYTLTAPL